MRNEMNDKKEFVLSAKSAVPFEESGGNIFLESGGEFTLPDYMPKVQKVLRVESRVLPPSRYIGAGEAQFSGNVLHTLMYVSEEGELHATILPSKYECTVPFTASGETPSISAQIVVDQLSYRLGAPRKISIRTRLRAKPRILGMRDLAEKQLPVGEITGLHKLICKVDGIRTQILRSPDVALSDTVTIGGGAEARPIWCGSTAAVQDVRVADGGVHVRGEVCTKVLLDNGGKTQMIMKKLPFEEFLDGEVQKGASATAFAYVVSTEAGKEQEDELLLNVALLLEAAVDTPCRIDAVQDAFCELSEGKVAYRSLSTRRLLCNRSAVYTVGGSVNKASIGAGGISAVLDTSGEAVVEEAVPSGGRLTVHGRCGLNSVFLTEEGEYASAEYAVPFTLAIDCETPESAAANVRASLLAARVRVDGDSLVCDMDLAVSARVTAEEECTVVETIDFSAPKVYPKSDYPLCLIYPRGELLYESAS